jgi:hypothetical protein
LLTSDRRERADKAPLGAVLTSEGISLSVLQSRLRLDCF